MSIRESSTLKIGGVSIGIEWDASLGPLSSDGLYNNFVSAKEPEVRLTIHDGPPPLMPRPEELVFDSESHWKLFETDGRSVVILQASSDTSTPYCAAIFEDSFRKGEVYRKVPTRADVGPDLEAPGALDHTLMQILAICLMSKGRGMLVHACGIEYNGRGYLFAGNSGHGKSTMAGLWEDRGLVLNDDRILLRGDDAGIRMYGAPWHGDHKSAINKGVPLEQCFFLGRGESNKAFAVNSAQACSMLLARSFTPLWDNPGMRFTLDFAVKLVSEIPCCELTFVPDKEVIDFILCRNRQTH